MAQGKASSVDAGSAVVLSRPIVPRLRFTVDSTSFDARERRPVRNRARVELMREAEADARASVTLVEVRRACPPVPPRPNCRASDQVTGLEVELLCSLTRNRDAI